MWIGVVLLIYCSRHPVPCFNTYITQKCFLYLSLKVTFAVKVFRKYWEYVIWLPDGLWSHHILTFIPIPCLTHSHPFLSGTYSICIMHSPYFGGINKKYFKQSIDKSSCTVTTYGGGESTCKILCRLHLCPICNYTSYRQHKITLPGGWPLADQYYTSDIQGSNSTPNSWISL